MPTGSLRRYAWPPWTTPATNPSGPELLSHRCKVCLVSIAKIFKNINEAVLKEVVLDLDYRRKKAEYEQRHPGGYEYPPSQIEVPEHLPADVEILESAILADIHHSTAELVASLAETSVVGVWTTAAATLLALQGDTSTVGWHTIKNKALDILELRQDAVALFEEVIEELSGNPHRDLYDALSTKLRALEKFARIYNRQPMPSTMEDRPSYDETYGYTPTPKRKQRRIYPAYPQLRQKHASTLTITVLIFMLLSFFPLIPAWQRSPDLAGSTTDADFWLLLQSSTMQLLGLFTAVYPLWASIKTAGWRWTQIFIILGCACALAAVPIYVRLPTMWSAVVSFLGAAAQAYMTLQLALVGASTSESRLELVRDSSEDVD